MNFQTELPLETNRPRIKPLRVRHNQSMLAWFHAPHQGEEAERRNICKKYYTFLAGFMLKPEWPGTVGNMPYKVAAQLLRQHHDFPLNKTALAQRRWVAKRIKLVCAMPNVTPLPRRLMMFDTLLQDHGGHDAIVEHHARAAKEGRKKSALRSKRYRDSCKFPASQPVRHIVTLQASTLLPDKTTTLYNASSPKTGVNQPQQAAGIVASRPKRANAVSANRAPKAKTSYPLTSFRSQRDKTPAQPAILSWLKRDVTRPDFDPRTNPAARRIYGHTPVDRQIVNMLKRVHTELTGLSYPVLRRRQATAETLMAACHQLTRQKSVTKPVNWVMWMEKALRDGARRYA